jgi:FkbM family methyltransferase
MVSQSSITEADIRSAYLFLLDREPDPDGLRHYSRKAFASSGYTIAHLRDEIRSSQEYRSVKDCEAKKVDLGGVFVVVDTKDPEFGATIARERTWEPHIIKLILEHLKDGSVFVDIGANVGVMSFTAAKAVGPNGRVVSFEPNQRNVQLFLRGVQANEFRNVSLMPFAASESREVFEVLGGSNAFLGQGRQTGNLVQGFPADEFLINQDRIDLIKMDIEGHEPLALRGMKGALRRHKPKILCEFNPRCLVDHSGIDPASFADQIFDLTSDVEIIEHSGRRYSVDSAAKLMSSWATANRDAVSSSLLPDGMLHFDLLFSADRSS